MSEYEYLLTDQDITYFQRRVPQYNYIVRRELGYMAAADIDPRDAKQLLLIALRNALQAYSQTEHTTRAGSILRRIAEFLSLLNPFAWKRTK